MAKDFPTDELSATKIRNAIPAAKEYALADGQGCGVPPNGTKVLRIRCYDAGPRGNHRAHGFRSTASTLLNEEGAFDGDVVEVRIRGTAREIAAARSCCSDVCDPTAGGWQVKGELLLNYVFKRPACRRAPASSTPPAMSSINDSTGLRALQSRRAMWEVTSLVA